MARLVILGMALSADVSFLVFAVVLKARVSTLDKCCT